MLFVLIFGVFAKTASQEQLDLIDAIITTPTTIPVPRDSFPTIDLPRFHFNGTCGRIFAHRRASSRDIVFFAHSASPHVPSETAFFQAELTLRLLRASMPDVTAVVFVVGHVPPHLLMLFVKYRVRHIALQGHRNWHAANVLLLAARSYLETNPGQFVRVASADLREVYIFEDAFRTCGDDDLVWMTVGDSPGARRVATHMAAMKLAQFFGNATAAEFRDAATDVVDKAFGIGGTQRMAAFLDAVVRDVNFKHKGRAGYCQAC